jgi:hypothetical protein
MKCTYSFRPGLGMPGGAVGKLGLVAWLDMLKLQGRCLVVDAGLTLVWISSLVTISEMSLGHQ